MADPQGKSGNDQGASAPEGTAAAPAQPQASPPEAQQPAATIPKLTEPAPLEAPPPVDLISEKEVRRLSRRELLKLSPLVLAGA
ncbi:MAG: hypothetical protein ACHP9S_02515 [Terriglobales bacterium]